MTHDEAFLQAILEDPEADTPRLVYADWLEERGDPRSEFIRVQCELARIGGGDPRSAELGYRQQQLLSAHRAEWLGPLRGVTTLYDPTFRRGFLEEMTLDARTFLELGERLFALHPLRHVSITDAGQGAYSDPEGHRRHVSTLAASPLLARLTSMGLPFIGDPGIEVLAASPHLARLTSLDLARGQLGPARALAASPYLRHLTRLNLVANRIGPEGAEALAGSPFLAHLTDLNLDGISSRHGDVENNISDRGAEALAASPYLTRLAKLTLYLNGISDAGVRALAASSSLANLVELKLHGNYLITDAGVKALAASPHLARLQTLWLGGVGAPGARALAASPALAGLWDLNVSISSTDEEARQVLRARFGNCV